MSNQSNHRQERIFKIFTPVRCMNRDQLPRYVDGHMTDVEKHLVEQHLVDCDLCCAAILALQDKRQYPHYERFSSELSAYLHREYAPAPKQQKQQVRTRQQTRSTQDSLLSGFWIIMFIVLGGGSIFLLQQHLKNRPALTLASARASDILSSDHPMATTDTNYTAQNDVPEAKPVSFRDTIKVSRDTVRKVLAVTNKDTLRKARLTDTAARVPVKKPDTAAAKAEQPKTTPPPPPPAENKPVEKKEEPVAEKKETPAEKPAEKPEEKTEDKTSASGDESLFRAAMQYQQTGNIDNAIDGFRRLSTNYKYAERAKYQLALCYQSKGQHSRAKRLFKEVVKMEGSMKSKAQSQLDKN